jgi:hypothetical protein
MRSRGHHGRLKSEHYAQAEDFRVPQRFARIISKRIRCATAGIDDVLKVWLQFQAGANFILGPHYVLDLWFERVVKGRLRGEARLVR